MSLSRRLFMGAGLLACCAPVLATQKNTPPIVSERYSRVALVQFINFGCALSLQMNQNYERIRETAASAGVEFRVAPVAWQHQGMWADMVYYAARDLYPGFEIPVRKALFDAFQRDGIRFNDVLQVLVYLRQHPDILYILEKNPGISMQAWQTQAESSEPMVAEYKAIRLLESSGVDQLPAFLWLSDGRIIHREVPKNGNVAALLSDVLFTLDPANP